MKKLVELVFRQYSNKVDEIQKGFISQENIEWVTEKLMLQYLTNEELSQMWETVDEYFLSLYAELDENGEVTAWKPYSKKTEFARDTSSAWLEVINIEARVRKANGLL